MYQLVYVSSETIRFTDEALLDLLKASRRRNEACRVSGLLLYRHGTFTQLLEGEKEDVLATFARISADPRHGQIITLLEGECAERDFEEWSMAFRKLDDSEAEDIPGYSDFLTRREKAPWRCSAALQMLHFFKEINS